MSKEINNYKWIFSGIGTLLIGTIIGFYLNSNFKKTDINLNGLWSITIKPTNGETAIGNCTIYQEKGNNILNVQGEIGKISDIQEDDHKYKFWSEFAGIHNNKLYLYYLNDRDEKGIMEGVISSPNANSFLAEYCDLYGFDKNNDIKGEIEFLRIGN